MKNFEIGKTVICLRYDIDSILTVTPNGFKVENRVDTHWFNRKAKVTEKYDTVNGIQYKIEFIDDGCTLAWVDEEELVEESPFFFGETGVNGITAKLC